MSTLHPNQDSEGGEARQKLRRSAKGTTCTHCRQLKLKCDSATVYPQDCTRCRRVGHQCVVDPQFRRRGNREYTQSLEKEVQTLRQLREKSPSSGASPNDHPTGTSSGSGGNVGGDALEDVRLSPATTISLIEIYFTSYHPYFPILPEKRDFTAEYDSNRLLLWTVLAIASRGRDDMPNVYASLVEPVRRLASDIYAPQSRSLKTMQALLLLCIWPFPHQQSINDPSTMYCSLATNIGYQLGLHRPLHRSDFVEKALGPIFSNLTERKTWYGCFIVNQGFALRLGLPTTMIPGNAIVSALNSVDEEIPTALILGLNIFYTSYIWTKALGDDESTSDGQHPAPAHFISTFENQMAQITEKFRSFAWPHYLRVEFEGVRLLVYSFALNQARPPSTQSEPFLPSATTEILQAKSLSATIDIATEARSDMPSLQYWPVFARFKVLFATCIGIFMAGKTSDEAMRKPLLETCERNVQLLFGWSVYKRDSFFRIATALATGVRRIQSHGPRGLLTAEEGTGRPEITSRMAGNVGYQLVWNAKHGKTPDRVEQPGPSYPAVSIGEPQTTIPHHPATAFNTAVGQQSQPEQVFGYSLQGIDDSMFWKDWTESDYTDIALDWQSMLDIQGQTWSQGM